MSGFWAVSRYDDVVAIARASERFNNSGGPQFGTSRPPLEVDRPEHTFFRRILQPHFAKFYAGFYWADMTALGAGKQKAFQFGIQVIRL